jgi:heme exporter protein D
MCTPSPAPTYTEAFRLACEARYLAALPRLEARRAYLKRVEERRGRPARLQLEEALLEQWLSK